MRGCRMVYRDQLVYCILAHWHGSVLNKLMRTSLNTMVPVCVGLNVRKLNVLGRIEEKLSTNPSLLTMTWKESGTGWQINNDENLRPHPGVVTRTALREVNANLSSLRLQKPEKMSEMWQRHSGPRDKKQFYLFLLLHKVKGQKDEIVKWSVRRKLILWLFLLYSPGAIDKKS